MNQMIEMKGIGKISTVLWTRRYMRCGEKHSQLGKYQSHKVKIIKVELQGRDDFYDGILWILEGMVVKNLCQVRDI